MMNILKCEIWRLNLIQSLTGRQARNCLLTDVFCWPCSSWLALATWGHHWVVLKPDCPHWFDSCNILIESRITSGVSDDIYNSCNQNKRECSLIQISLIRCWAGPDSSARVWKSFCAAANFPVSKCEKAGVAAIGALPFWNGECCWQSSAGSATSAGRTPTSPVCTQCFPTCWA